MKAEKDLSQRPFFFCGVNPRFFFLSSISSFFQSFMFSSSVNILNASNEIPSFSCSYYSSFSSSSEMCSSYDNVTKEKEHKIDNNNTLVNNNNNVKKSNSNESNKNNKNNDFDEKEIGNMDSNNKYKTIKSNNNYSEKNLNYENLKLETARKENEKRKSVDSFCLSSDFCLKSSLSSSRTLFSSSQSAENCDLSHLLSTLPFNCSFPYSSSREKTTSSSKSASFCFSTENILKRKGCSSDNFSEANKHYISSKEPLKNENEMKFERILNVKSDISALSLDESLLSYKSNSYDYYCDMIDNKKININNASSLSIPSSSFFSSSVFSSSFFSSSFCSPSFCSPSFSLSCCNTSDNENNDTDGFFSFFCVKENKNNKKKNFLQKLNDEHMYNDHNNIDLIISNYYDKKAEDKKSNKCLGWYSTLTTCLSIYPQNNATRYPSLRNNTIFPFFLIQIFSLCSNCHIIFNNDSQINTDNNLPSYVLTSKHIGANKNLKKNNSKDEKKIQALLLSKQDDKSISGNLRKCRDKSNSNNELQESTTQTIESMLEKTDNIVVLGKRILYCSGELHKHHLTDSGGVQFRPKSHSNFQLNVVLLMKPSECAFMLGIAPRVVDLACPSLEMHSGFYFFSRNQTLFAQDGTVGVEFSSETLRLHQGCSLGISYNVEDSRMHILLNRKDVGVCRFNIGEILSKNEYYPTLLFADQSCYIEVL